jgi:hypothetical protein
MAHEQSETVERDGQYVNVYGRNTPRAGEPLPDSPSYSTLANAVGSAEDRSRMTLETRGVFEDQGPSTPLLDFTGSLGLEPQPAPSRSDTLMGQRGAAAAERKTAETAMADRATSGAAELKGLAKEQTAERAALEPTSPALPQGPDVSTRPFLQPNPSLLSQMNALMLGFGQMALQIGGLKGNAVGATAAYKGAVEGWLAGDQERVDRELTNWKNESSRLLATHKLAVDKFGRTMADQKRSWDERLAALGMEFKGLEWTAASKAAEVGDIDALLKHYDAAEQRHEMMVLRRDQLAEAFRTHNQTDARVREVADLNRVERARESDQRVSLATRKFQQAGQDPANDLSPQAIEMYARAVADAGPQAMPPMGMGKASTEARIKIGNRAAQIRIERGDGAGGLALTQANYRANSAELTRLQTQRGPVLAYASAAENNLSIALRESEKVDREQFPAFNKWLLSGEKNWAGDPNVAAFAIAMRVAVDETARVLTTISGGQTTDTARREVEDVISTAQNPEQLRRVVGIVREDFQGRVKGYDGMIAATQAALARGGRPAAAKRKAVAPDGTAGMLPSDTDLSKYPGYKWE